jgi:hypothetical protein
MPTEDLLQLLGMHEHFRLLSLQHVVLTFSHGSRLQLSFCCIMVLLYIYQFIFYFIHRLNATSMLCLQVYGSVFITYLGYWEGWAFLPGNTIWGSLLPGILTTTAYGFTLL